MDSVALYFPNLYFLVIQVFVVSISSGYLTYMDITSPSCSSLPGRPVDRKHQKVVAGFISESAIVNLEEIAPARYHRVNLSL